MRGLLVLLSCIGGVLRQSAASRPTIIAQSLNQTTSRMVIVFDNFLELNRRRGQEEPVSTGFFGRRCSKYMRTPSFSGHCNNLLENNWGASNTKFKKAGMSFANSFRNRPNARTVSNVVCKATRDKPSSRGISEFATFFGQFLDHTVTETENTEEKMDIPIPPNDPVFIRGGRIPFFRTKKAGFSAMESPINKLSSYIDGASIYGATEKNARSLRLRKSGLLRMSKGNLLPKNNRGFFIAGDGRVNENPLLTCLHTLWAREHNRVAREILSVYPSMNDDKTYNLARLIVIAELQAVTFYEFVPAVLGKSLPPYTGYKTWLRADITDEFSTVGYRVGHTLVNPHVTSIDFRGRVKNRRKLRDAFFNPKAFIADGMDALLRGLTNIRAAEVDNEITDEVRNFLVSSDVRRTIQLDLATLNIQRGRDHNMPTFSNLRMSFGLPPVYSYSDITSDFTVQRKLESVYGDVANVDPWVAGISEDHASGSLGRTFAAIWEDQFVALRDGDRFYFEKAGVFEFDHIQRIPTLRKLLGKGAVLGGIMRDIILLNSGLRRDEVGPNPFFARVNN